MPFKLGLLMMVCGLFTTAQAAEKESLPMDLIELLGELGDDNQDSFDQESLEAAMSDIKTPALPSKQKHKMEVGGQK
jgi:hypothetical protein